MSDNNSLFEVRTTIPNNFLSGSQERLLPLDPNREPDNSSYTRRSDRSRSSVNMGRVSTYAELGLFIGILGGMCVAGTFVGCSYSNSSSEFTACIALVIVLMGGVMGFFIGSAIGGYREGNRLSSSGVNSTVVPNEVPGNLNQVLGSENANQPMVLV